MYRQLLNIVPHLEERLMADNHSDEDILHVGDLVSTFLQLSNSRITACIVS